MSNFLFKYPRVFIASWFVFFAAIVVVPATGILVLKNSHSADFWVQYGIASLIASAIVGALLASLYISKQHQSLSRSSWYGVLIAVVSLLVSGLLVVILTGLFNPYLSILNALLIFPAALFFVGWAVIPVGAIAGFVLHYFNPYVGGKNKIIVAGMIGYSGLVLLLVDIILIFNPASMLQSSEYVERPANWYLCCKYPNGFGPSGRNYIEVVFLNDKKEKIAIHYLHNEPHVWRYLQKIGSEQVAVTIEVKRYLGKRLSYRVKRIGNLDINEKYMKPIKIMEVVLDNGVDGK